MLRPALSLVVLTALLAGVSGCGARTATVHGKVTHEGKPAALATITFVGSDGWTSNPVTIDANGGYTVREVPIGSVTVAILGEPPLLFNPEVTGATKSDDPEAIAREKAVTNSRIIPPRYGDPKTSGLVYEIRGGDNVIDINLP